MTETAGTTAPPADPTDDIVAGFDEAPVQPGTKGGATSRHNVHTTSFTDDDIKTYEFDVFKGRKGVIDRVGVLVPESITYGRTHFVDKVGYFICHSEWKMVGGQEVCTKIAPCCEKLEAPDKRFACLIIHYNTDAKGALVKPFSYALKVWRFSASKYVELRELNREWPLANHDLKINTEDEQYQRMSIQACRDKVAAAETFKAKHGPEVEQWIKGVTPKLPQAVGKTFTERELLEKLGMAQAPAVVQQTAAVESIAELLEG